MYAFDEIVDEAVDETKATDVWIHTEDRGSNVGLDQHSFEAEHSPVQDVLPKEILPRLLQQGAFGVDAEGTRFQASVARSRERVLDTSGVFTVDCIMAVNLPETKHPLFAEASVHGITQRSARGYPKPMVAGKTCAVTWGHLRDKAEDMYRGGGVDVSEFDFRQDRGRAVDDHGSVPPLIHGRDVVGNPPGAVDGDVPQAGLG